MEKLQKNKQTIWGSCTLLFSGVKTEENRKGRTVWGVKGYVDGMFGDPSLTKNKRKNVEKHYTVCEKHKKKKKNMLFNMFPEFFLCFDTCFKRPIER